jgi:DNA-binding MarR family transcriptional regulator
MPTTPTFSARALGETEKALNGILRRELAGTGLTEPQWVILTLTVFSGGTVERDELAGRVAGVFKISQAEAQARIAELATTGLFEAPGDEGSPVKVTDAGQQLHARIRSATTQITERLWGDLPAEDLATAGRVLSTVLARADAELAA